MSIAYKLLIYSCKSLILMRFCKFSTYTSLLWLNARNVVLLIIILFNDGIIGLDIQKYCTDNKETIKDALLELRINKYIKYDSETKKLIAAPVPYTEWDEDLR